MILRTGIVATLLGFLVVDIFLATNHPGSALKLTNYLFWFLFATVTLVILKDEIKD